MKRLFAALFAALAFAAIPAQSAEIAGRISLRLEDGRIREAQVLSDSESGRRGLLYYAKNSYQALWLDQIAIAKINSAFDKYGRAFDKRRLKRSSPGSTIRAYGFAPCDLQWGSKKDDLSRFSPSKISLGYVFAGNSPYFCISSPCVKSFGGSKSPALESSESVRLLLTRAAMKSLLAPASSE